MMLEPTGQYYKNTLSSKDLKKNPFSQFESWLTEAKQVQPQLYNAMTLATSFQGQPQARIVLLKSFDSSGFVFYSHNNSPKGVAITKNNKVALLFFWEKLERQIRVEGGVEILSKQRAQNYFYQRSTASQWSCLASNQSVPIANRSQLEHKVEQLKKMHSEMVPYDDSWTCYRVKPCSIEFWQGRDNRLHDRFLYSKSNSTWHITRLQP